MHDENGKGFIYNKKCAIMQVSDNEVNFIWKYIK